MEATSTTNVDVKVKIPFTKRVKSFMCNLGNTIVELGKTIGMGLWCMFKTPFIAAKNVVANMWLNFKILFNQKNSSENVYLFMNKEVNYMGFVLLNLLTTVAMGVILFLLATTFNILYLCLGLILLSAMSLIEYK